MKTCIYCDVSKPESEFTSLEHLIPQFLGGSCAPDRFKTYDACARCNSVLGLFVDGSFAKSWMVTNWLTFAGIAAYTSNSTIGPPLMFMGVSPWAMPGIGGDEVCECWLGPAGEQIYLIRPEDERFYWYAGGNPIGAKQLESRAYFTFSERSNEDARKTLLAFRDAFSGTRTKKICCTVVDGFDMTTIGFSRPDEIDLERVEFLRVESQKDPVRKVSIPTKLNFDHRFISKIALGVGYALFGREIFRSDYYKELQRGLWYREGDPVPEIYGTSLFGNYQQINAENFKKIIGVDHAVTLAISVVPEGAALTLALGSSHVWTVLCARREVFNELTLKEINDGRLYVIFPFLSECVELTMADFLSHRLGVCRHHGLASAEVRASAGKSGCKEGAG